MNTPSNELHIFQVAADDIGILWTDLLRLAPNPLSPIGPDLKEYAPGSGQVTPELQKIAAQPQAVKAAAMLAQPDLRLHCWMGGATTSLSYAVFCRSRAVDPDGVAVFAPSYQGSLLVNYFPSVAMGATWGADVLGSDVTGEPPLLLPPVMPLESAVYAFHTIDCFRRVAYQSMLEHVTLETPHLTVPQFTAAFNQSLASADIRWLLPAFLQMTTGVRDLPFAPRSEHLGLLVEEKILRPVRVGEAREPAYAFGEAGRLLGIEFLRTWWTAAALTLDLLEGDAVRKDQRIFVAPTAVANHWFTVKEVSGGAVVDCAPLTQLAMQQRLADLLETPAPEPPAAFCPSCGEKIQPGARFCRACGYRLVA